MKAIRGRHDQFQRLRVGSWCVLFDLDSGTRVLLVHGVVPRSDLDRWLRGR